MDRWKGGREGGRKGWAGPGDGRHAAGTRGYGVEAGDAPVCLRFAGDGEETTEAFCGQVGIFHFLHHQYPVAYLAHAHTNQEHHARSALIPR